MKITLTNNLLIDLFRRNRNAPIGICGTAASLRRADDPEARIQLVLHADQLGQLDYRLKVLLEDKGSLCPEDYEDACRLKSYLELICFLMATEPWTLKEHHLHIGDFTGADNELNRAAAAAKRDLAPKIRSLSMDYALLDLERVTVAFAQYTQAILFHHVHAVEKEMVERLSNVGNEPLPPIWIPQYPFRKPPICMTIFERTIRKDEVLTDEPKVPDESGAECGEGCVEEQTVEAVDPKSLEIFPFLGICHTSLMNTMFGDSSAPLISESLAEALNRKW